MAASALGSATISFGLVAIPVKLFSTTKTSSTISFRMVHKKCGTPLKQQYVCPTDEEVVPREDIGKGYEFVKDQYVLFTPEEVKAVDVAPGLQRRDVAAADAAVLVEEADCVRELVREQVGRRLRDAPVAVLVLEHNAAISIGQN